MGKTFNEHDHVLEENLSVRKHISEHALDPERATTPKKKGGRPRKDAGDKAETEPEETEPTDTQP